MMATERRAIAAGRRLYQCKENEDVYTFISDPVLF